MVKVKCIVTVLHTHTHTQEQLLVQAGRKAACYLYEWPAIHREAGNWPTERRALMPLCEK